MAEVAVRVPTGLGELAVRVFEPPASEGPTVVLWPSMFVDGHTYDRLVPLLPRRRLVIVDGPGLGVSSPLRRVASVAEAADAAGELLTGPLADRLHIGGPVDWVGNAFGGHVGYDLARRPGLLRSLVAVSAPPEPISAQQQRQIRLLSPVLRAVGPIGPVRSAIVSALLTDTSAADPQLRDIVLDGLRRPQRGSLALAVRSFISERTDVSALLPSIDVPCLFVAGADRGDWTPAAAQQAAAAVPRATAVTVPNARTLVPLEQPEALAAELIGFWHGLVPASGS